MTGDNIDKDRRSFLKWTSSAAVASTALLAGCSSDDETTTETTGGDTPMDGDTPAEDGDTPAEDGDTPSEDGSTSTPSAQKMGGQIDAGMEAAASTLDPNNMVADVDWRVSVNIWEPLISRDTNFQPNPQLGAEYNVAEDGASVTITLRDEDVYFHPPEDRQMTMDDVVYSIERLTDPERSGRAGAMSFVSNFEAVSDSEIRFEFENPYAPAVGRMKDTFVMPENWDNNYDPATEPIGTGPFMKEEFASGSHVLLAAHDKYYETDSQGNQLPYVNNVMMRGVPEVSSRVTNLRSGELHHISPVPGSQISNLQGGNVTVKSKPGTKMIYAAFNTRNSPFDDVKLRRGLNWTVDRQEIIQGAFFGKAQPIQHPTNPNTVFWDKIEVDNPYSQDLEKAQQLIEESSYDGETYQIKVAQGHAGEVNTAKVLQQQFEEAGFDTEINMVDNNTWLNDIAIGGDDGFSFDIAVSFWGGIIDPNGSYQWWSNERLNNSGLTNEKIDQWWKAAQQTFDTDERATYYEKMANRLVKLAPYIFCVWANLTVAYRNELKGYVMFPNSAKSQIFKTAWLDN